MTRMCSILGLWAIVLMGAAGGSEVGWEYRLAAGVSNRLGEIEEELAAIEGELPAHPDLPLADLGGTGGFVSLHQGEKPEAGDSFSVTVTFAEPGAVDLVALVPARRYGVGGLEAQFGMPDAFRVELLDDAGEVVAELGEKHDLWANPVRAGHPFVFSVAPAVEAAALRISAERLRFYPDVSDSFVHAWAEAFAFEGVRNLAQGAEVSTSSGTAPLAPWHWKKTYLIDGQTPLGLPESPESENRNIGWLSEGRQKATEAVWLELDLGQRKEFDGVRMFPAKPPTADLPSGFGFPHRFTLSVSDSRTSRNAKAAGYQKQVEMANPGHSPVYLPIERSEGRFVKVNVTELWKAYESYPAFFALSEIEVLDGEENLALGAAVRSPNGMGTIMAPGSRFWSAVSLTDGFGPDGLLQSRRDWLLGLKRRLELEEARFSLSEESRAIVDGWRRFGLTGFAILGVAGAFVLIALPLRYRAREKRELSKVRERIAGDLHDEVGSNLGSIQMFADLAEGRSGSSEELKRIQRIAAETVSAVRDIVWLLRPQGDHRIATVEHMRETASIMLEPHEWEFTANEAAWQCELSDEENRHLFLFFREAMHNILRHAKATLVKIHVEVDDQQFRLTIADNGCGITEEKLQRKSTLRALHQRVEALGAKLNVESSEGAGTRLGLQIPRTGKRPKRKIEKVSG